ncbi:VPLPA-CTERM sorting domain-containing protein [Cereibacter azotoformans]|nr:VPLPA-CTERM sorting domain-containing protein [Cereibacter azotoformans]UIJ29274.1 VPLPA-CTERM sorting domain-containing protein [Cereibacter azotoformans]
MDGPVVCRAASIGRMWQQCGMKLKDCRKSVIDKLVIIPRFQMFFLRYFARALPAVAVTAFLAGAGSVSAATVVSCPGTAITTDRDFTVGTDSGSASCLAYGPGNVSLPGGNLLDKTDDRDAPGSVILSVSGLGGTSGFWSILVPTGYTLTNAILAFKTGVAMYNPDWAAFSLTDGALSGSWSVDKKHGLSHADLYGRLEVSEVPLPATGLLLLAGLGGLAVLRRRRKPA